MSHPERHTTLEQVWAELKVGLEKVFGMEPLSAKAHMALYTQVYNYCTSCAVVPQKRSRRPNGQEEFAGEELYNEIAAFLKAHIVRLSEEGEALTDEALLTFYARRWKEFKFSAKVANAICAYLNRHWIKRELDEGRASIHEIYDLALILWKKHLLDALCAQITGALLRLIEHEREGETINASLLRDTIDCYVEFGGEETEGSNEAAAAGPQVDLYRSAFETPFLEATTAFYTRESQQLIASCCSLDDYMKKVEQVLGCEEKRVATYLHSTTSRPLERVCLNAMVKRELGWFRAEFESLLALNRREDIVRMYAFVSRVRDDDDVPALRMLFETHVEKEGLSVVESVGDRAANDPKLYVRALLDAHALYGSLVDRRRARRTNCECLASIDRVAFRFVNKNAVTTRAGSSTKSAELLARYCDLLLRKTSDRRSSKDAEEADFGHLFDKVMTIFPYINDKDLFMRYYSKLLAKRLFGELSTSADAESSMIARLKQACGFDYTAKLHRMFQDVETSKDLDERFREQLQSSSILLRHDLSMMVLTSGSWPLPSSSSSFYLPHELEQSVQRFTAFYVGLHPGRRLTWLHQISRGELTSVGFDRRYTLTATTFQMAVLLQFNQGIAFPLSELSKNLGLALDDLALIVTGLATSKLVAIGGQTELSASTVVRISSAFSSKKLKVDLTKQPATADVKEGKTIEKSVEQDRRFAIQAAIVRIMKMRKSLNHVQLIAEVLSQLSAQFKPGVPAIKKCIDVLIEKEYVKRADGEKDVYEYVS